MSDNVEFLIQHQTLKNIADSIRNVANNHSEMTPSQMSTEIRRLTATIDQSYDEDSENPQSGKAVAEAVAPVEAAIQENRADIKNNKDNIEEEKNARIAADEELSEQIRNITAVQIRNKDVIECIESEVQTVATNYIVTNYNRQPQNFDGLIITVIDRDNDKILYIYSTVSSIWINSGINDVDLSNYYTKEEVDEKLDNVSTVKNIKDSIGDSSLQQIQDSSYTSIAIKTKNPNAYQLDNSLTDNEPIGATGQFATSFGGNTSAQGKRSLAEGTSTVAKGKYSHAEGDNSVTLGNESHAEGYNTVAYGQGSHSEGGSTQAIGRTAHSEGQNTIATGIGAHAEGELTQAKGNDSHAEGANTIAEGYASHSEGMNSSATGGGSHAEGSSTASGDNSHAEGRSKAVGDISHSENSATAKGGSSHAEGRGITEVGGEYSHAEGSSTANNTYAHAEGDNTVASGVSSHSEGFNTTASGIGSHAQGNGSVASGNYSSARGFKTNASGEYAHSEGQETQSIGISSHAEGINTKALGIAAHSGGTNSQASGKYSFAHGENVTATQQDQFVVGKFNKNKTDTLFEVGNGSNKDNLSNAFEVFADGHAELLTQGNNSNSVATRKLVEDVDATYQAKCAQLDNSIGDVSSQLFMFKEQKQNKLTAGDNITIDENNVISATGQGMADRFELIADVTTSEELQQLDVAEDSVGNPLDLKEVFAECITASGTAGFGRFIIYNGTKAIGQVNTLQVLNEKSNTSTLWVKSLGNNNFVSITNNLGTPIDEPLYATSSAQQTLVINKATGKATIIKISIRGNNTVIPAGTRLRIWGVKA